MASLTITRGSTLPDSAAKADFHNLVDLATGAVSNIVDADIASGAAIVATKLAGSIPDSKLSTITTAGKVNTSALVTTSQAAGDVMYNDGTNWKRLAKDEGKYLKSGASAVSWDTPSVAAVAGMVVQVVNTTVVTSTTGSTALPYDDTIPQNTEGDEYMTLAITPSSATNKLKIDVVCNVANASSQNIAVALFQDTTAGALACVGEDTSGAGRLTSLVFTYYMAAGTTSATTFKVRAGAASGTTTFNGVGGSRYYGGVLASSITITEIKV